MSVVIVESAAKAKTIQKYLNDIDEIKHHKPFTVIACFGHVRDLPAKGMGVDVESWTATYEPLDNKKQIIGKLKSACSSATRIFLASDPDLEGEAIAAHLYEVLSLKKRNTSRVTFNEITKTALKNAMLNTRDIDYQKVNAQESRRILDRVVGYELSPLLWRRFASGGLSAGRVQSAALKLLVDRAREAAAHAPTPFWVISGVFKLNGDELEAKMNGVWDAEGSEATVQKALKYLANPKLKPWMATFTQREAKRSPPPPFTTSTLQQEAYSKHGFIAKRTMQIAQGLYEAGHITYMRTDSTAIAEEARAGMHEAVAKAYGEDSASERVFKSRAANAQEAHEAIRPTHFNGIPDGLAAGSPERKLYDLIYRRAISSQMSAAVYIEFSYTIASEAENAATGYIFKGKHSVLISPGYLQAYDQKVDKAGLAKWQSMPETAEVAPIAFEATGDVTRPPSLYNEPALIAQLERDGIGRPSTYASILEKLYQRGYVRRGTNPQHTVHVNSYKISAGSASAPVKEEQTILVGGREIDRMVPTSLGERVVGYLEETAPFILDVKFTAGVESDLDSISHAKTTKEKVLDDFYKTFHAAIEKADARSDRAARKKKAEGAEASAPAPLSPRNIIREFPNQGGVQVVETRYGPALYDKKDNSFVGLVPFLQWRKKTVDELTQKDVAFLRRLPLEFEGTPRKVVMGRYGLYVKDGEENLSMYRPLWDKAYDGELTPKDITEIVHTPSNTKKKRTFRK